MMRLILICNRKFFSNFIQMEYFQIGGNSVSNRVFCRRDLNESTRGMRGQKYTHTYTHKEKERERFFYCKGEAEIVAHLIVTRVQFPWPPAKKERCIQACTIFN